MELNLEILKAKSLQDAEAILQIDRMTFQDCHAEPEEVIRILGEQYPAYIAWLGDRPVGYICLMQVVTLHYRACWVDLVAVDPAYQGRGIAKALIAVGQRHARETGAQFLSALVRKGNSPSLEAFLQKGFNPVGQGFDLLVHELQTLHEKNARE